MSAGDDPAFSYDSVVTDRHGRKGYFFRRNVLGDLEATWWHDLGYHPNPDPLLWVPRDLYERALKERDEARSQH